MPSSYLRVSAFICGCILLSSTVHADEPRFTISYWCGPPAKFNSLERYQEIKDANFTLAFPPCGGMSVEQNRQMLDYCQQVGLKAVVMDRRMVKALAGKEENKAKLDAIVKDYSDHPALFGYTVADEPGTYMFNALAEVIAYLKEKDPAHPGFINLLPTYAREFNALGAKSYEDHVEQFVEKVKPSVISYDHYHFTNRRDREDFFENLYTVREVALQSKLPFWNIVLATQHFDYRHLTEAELRFEAMQTLAFGASGLLWFTYWSPADKSAVWQHALILPDGSRDPHYDMIKKINAEVLAIGNELITCESIAVFQPGKAVTTQPSVAEKSPPRKADATSPIKIIDEGDLTVGVFKRGERRLALIANRDYKAQTTSRAVVQPIDAEVALFDPARKEWGRAPIRERGVIEISLSPGRAMLLRW